MLTLLRENSVSCRVLAALHQGRTQRNPQAAEAVRAIPSPLMTGVYIPSITFPGAFPDPSAAHPAVAEAAFPREVASDQLVVNPARRRGMVLHRSTWCPALLQRRPGRHLTLVAHEAIAQ